METFDQAGSGYPEEGPPGADPSGDDSEVRERSEDKADEQSGATGNPNTD